MDLLIMIPVSYYLFYILHNNDFFRKVSISSKINSALHYYEFSYVDPKYLDKYQQRFVNLMTEWCVFLFLVYVTIQGSFLCCSIELRIASAATIKF